MFWNKKKSPITLEDEEWITSCFKWFELAFDTNLKEQEIFTSSNDFLDFEYQGSEDDVLSIVDLIGDKMQVSSSSSISIYFYDEFQQLEFTDEGTYANYEEGTQLTDGQFSKLVDGIYEIGIERSLLNNLDRLIATIAHEVAHIKLIGEERIEENDEPLTDITASLFGFAIFLANSSISKMTTWNGNTHTGWKISGASGYLHHKMYAFLLGYWLVQKGMTSDKWFDYMDKEILNDVKKTIKYLEVKDGA